MSTRRGPKRAEPKEHRPNNQVCPVCRSGYKQSVADDGRPRFTCTRCDHEWTCGLSGGEWLLAKPKLVYTSAQLARLIESARSRNIDGAELAALLTTVTGEPQLVPPDPKRCQSERKDGSFMTLGPRQWIRCSNVPDVIVKEVKPGKDGKHGSMSLCEGCLARMGEQRPAGSFAVEQLP